MVAELTLAGITRTVTLIAGEFPEADSKRAEGAVGSLVATTTIRRSQFGFAPKYPTAAVGGEITIVINLKAVRH